MSYTQAHTVELVVDVRGVQVLSAGGGDIAINATSAKTKTEALGELRRFIDRIEAAYKKELEA